MASNATLSHLKTRLFPGEGGGGVCPQTPLVSYVYIPLHSIYISAYTSIITALHVFYRCLGYHIYIHVPDPLLYFVITPPSPCYIHTIHASNLCVYLVRQSITVILNLPPKNILILDRTLTTLPYTSCTVYTVISTKCECSEISNMGDTLKKESLSTNDTA